MYAHLSLPSFLRGRAVAALLLGAVLAVLATLSFASSARADFVNFEQIKTQKNEAFCIGISGASQASGAPAGLFNCASPNINGDQKYRFLGHINKTQIKAQHGAQLCLRVLGNSSAVGAQVVQGSCTSVSAQWELVNLSDGVVSRLATIRNRHTRDCIGYSGGFVFNGAQIQTFDCGFQGFSNQNWVVNPTGGLMPF